MKFKGLVWGFTILLILISLWELSYTWVVRSYEGKVKEQATRLVKNQTTGMSEDDREAIIKEKTLRILDSTKEKEIFPIVGTTYEKCKKYELNLGLDLQGGMGVTMDVSLQGLVKSLSNNQKDPALLKALQTAKAQQANSGENFIELFSKTFIAQNGAGKLSALFSGANKEVKISDNDATVTSKLKETGAGAIKQTFKILQKRIDKFGVAQPNLNLDLNKGVINVELAGVTNAQRVRDYLQSSANLQFWSVVLLKDQAFQKSFFDADKALAKFLKADTATNLSAEEKAKRDSLAQGVITTIMALPVDQKTGQLYDAGIIGTISKKDTGLLNSS